MTDNWAPNHRRHQRKHKLNDNMTRILEDMLQKCGSDDKCLDCQIIAPLLERAKKLLVKR